MATSHLSAQVISRGSGHSAVKASAYRARIELHDERTGETHDYSRHRSKCVFEGIYAPKDAPEWAHDRSALWNHVEACEKHKRAELAQEINIALPHELTVEQNRWLLQDWIKENVTRKGLIADAAIHAPDPRGDDRNVHAHVMIVRRKLDGSEFVRAKERFDTFSEKQKAKEADLDAMRGSWETLTNRHLKRHGHEARIDMGRKKDAEPTIHLGKTASQMERQGIATDRGDHNREVDASNDNRRQVAEAEAERRTLAELKIQQTARLERQARDAADVEAENTPQHGKAKPSQPDRNAGDVARPLEALAITDPMRFAAAASAARELAYRPPPVKAAPLGASVSFIIPGHPEPMPAPVREPQAGRAVSIGTDLPGRVPEAPQRASYEVEKSTPEAKPVKWHQKAIEAGRSMLAQLGDRLDYGIEVFRERGQGGRKRDRMEPKLVVSPRQDPGAQKRHEDPQHVFQQSPRQPVPPLQPRPHVRVRSYLTPATPQARESVRRQAPAHAPQPVAPRIAQPSRPAAQPSSGRAAPVRPVENSRIEQRPAKSENTRHEDRSDRLKQADAEKAQRQADRQEAWEQRIALQNAMRDLEQKAKTDDAQPDSTRTAWDELMHSAQENADAKDSIERLQGLLPRSDDDNDNTRGRSR